MSTGVFDSAGEFVRLPNKTVYDELIDTIQSAEEKVWIEIYTWTDLADLTEAVIDAMNRGVDVRVLLEKNVYGNPIINNATIKKLRDAGVPLVFSDPLRYTFTHAKFWIIDDSYVISTGNFTKSFFEKNREYMYRGTDPLTRSFLEQIFLADTASLAFRDTKSIPSHMVLSPVDSREKIANLIQSTEEDIVVFVQSLDDPVILRLLADRKSAGKKVIICTADNGLDEKNGSLVPEVPWFVTKKIYLHAKIVLVDSGSVFLGSQNFTTNALENNREVGIILRDRPDIVDKIRSDVERDCEE